LPATAEFLVIFLLYVSEAVSLSASHGCTLNSCINSSRPIYKIFGVGNADCIKHIRRFVDLHDIVKPIEDTFKVR